VLKEADDDDEHFIDVDNDDDNEADSNAAAAAAAAGGGDQRCSDVDRSSMTTSSWVHRNNLTCMLCTIHLLVVTVDAVSYNTIQIDLLLCGNHVTVLTAVSCRTSSLAVQCHQQVTQTYKATSTPVFSVEASSALTL